MLLQEIHLHAFTDPILKSIWIQHQFHAAGSSKSRGTAVLLSKNVHFQLTDTESDPRGHFLFVKGILEVCLTTVVLL